MLKIEKQVNGDSAVFAPTGRLDTASAPEFEQAIAEALGSIKSLKLDFKNLDYISSAGLRVLLSAQKAMNQKGEMLLTNVNDSVMEILEVTGFTDILTIA